MQTYQSVYYMMLLLNKFPYELSPLFTILRYSNGFDDIITPEYTRSYTLTTRLSALGIEKEFLANINIGLCLIVIAMIALGILAAMRTRQKIKM